MVSFATSITKVSYGNTIMFKAIFTHRLEFIFDSMLLRLCDKILTKGEKLAPMKTPIIKIKVKARRTSMTRVDEMMDITIHVMMYNILY